MNRRSLLKACSTIGAAVATSQGWGAVLPFFRRQNLPIGLQLYTLDDQLAEDLDGTLAQIRKIGYQSVELAGFYGRSAQQFRHALDAQGLVCRGAHIQAVAKAGDLGFDGDVGRIAEAAHILGIEEVVVPAFLFPAGFVPPARADGRATFRAAGTLFRPDDSAAASARL